VVGVDAAFQPDIRPLKTWAKRRHSGAFPLARAGRGAKSIVSLWSCRRLGAHKERPWEFVYLSKSFIEVIYLAIGQMRDLSFEACYHLFGRPGTMIGVEVP
jgi:hypothetical protein